MFGLCCYELHLTSKRVRFSEPIVAFSFRNMSSCSIQYYSAGLLDLILRNNGSSCTKQSVACLNLVIFMT